MELPPPKAVDILLVDDNPGKMLALETALAPLGQNLVKASSGREALRQLLDRDFATVILDVNMPDMDGFETARMIRARGRSASTPIIFVSAINLDEADAHRGYSLGAVDYIFAPIIPDVLRAKVTVFVELHRRTEEARLQAQRLEERTRELEQSQRELRLAERMATIGTLCAGLGHDMGNLLLPITFWMEELKPERLPEEYREGMDSIRTCVQYLRRLSAGLRLVALDPEQDFGDGVTPLEDWAGETGAILRNALPRGLKLELSIAPGLPHVRIARHQLTQAVFNLVQNAGEALRDRKSGVVRVWAEHDAPSGGVRIGVADNGPGMPPEVLAHCFDPFFTTKTRSISTGLGLSLVNGIVQKAGSSIQVTSAPDAGTTFTFVLRAVGPEAPQRPLAVVTLEEPRVRGYTIGLLRTAGFELVPAIPEAHRGSAVWITQPSADLEAAAENFIGGDAARRVLVYARQPEEAGGFPTFTLSGGAGGLGQRLRDFLSQWSGAGALIGPKRLQQEQPA
ncbi:MAG TPA: ATP-binding protein [Phycisphaerales bacterium]|nr:ATP-binding protein [Phycisphaerales bacterium]